MKLKRGGYSCTAVVFLQKNPPHDLLIGTDLLPSFGFQFIQKAANSDVAIDIFTDKKYVEGPEETSAVEKSPKQGMESSYQVELISAVRVPAQHEKLIKAKVCKNSIDMILRWHCWRWIEILLKMVELLWMKLL